MNHGWASPLVARRVSEAEASVEQLPFQQRVADASGYQRNAVPPLNGCSPPNLPAADNVVFPGGILP